MDPSGGVSSTRQLLNPPTTHSGKFAILGIALVIIGLLGAFFGNSPDLANAGIGLAIVGGVIFVPSMIVKIKEWIREWRESSNPAIAEQRQNLKALDQASNSSTIDQRFVETRRKEAEAALANALREEEARRNPPQARSHSPHSDENSPLMSNYISTSTAESPREISEEKRAAATAECRARITALDEE